MLGLGFGVCGLVRAGGQFVAPKLEGGGMGS
jgi:hypothetical protein